MLKAFLICTLLTIHMTTYAESVDAKEQTDIERFVEDAEVCDHLAGEWDPILSKPDQRTIEKNVEIYCGRAKKQQIMLKKKYKDRSEIMKKLDGYESVNFFHGKIK